MTLIAAAVISRRHAPHVSTGHFRHQSGEHGPQIELTGLAHRKHYRTQQGIEHWLKVKFETIPVSKQRYERLPFLCRKP